MTAPRAILFDIGSTLWSSPAEDEGALAGCYDRGRDILINAGIQEVPSREALVEAVEGYFAYWEDVWRADAGQVIQPPTCDYVAEALKRLGLAPGQETLLAFTDAILQTSVYTAKVLPEESGMKEAMADLKASGVRLACVSNAFMGGDVLQQIMTERGLGEFLEFTVSSCETGYRKPHSFIYQAALVRLGVAAEATIFVGDRLDADIEGPAALKMQTVLSHQYRQEDPIRARVQPDHVIAHLSELAPYVRSLLGQP